MKSVFTALVLMLACSACTQQESNRLTTAELAQLSGVSTTIVRPPADALAGSTSISLVRLEGGKVQTLGGVGTKNIPIEQGHGRIPVSLRQQNAKNVITIVAGGITSRIEIHDDYKPVHWFGQPEEDEGVYVFSSDGETDKSYKDNKGVAYGLKLNAGSNK